MNNERYLRVEGEEGHANDDTEEEVEGDMRFAWRPQKRFQPLAQEEEDDDRTTPTDNRKSPISLSRSSSWDEEESDLQRYQIDFSNTSMQEQLKAATLLDDSIQQGQITLRLLFQSCMETRELVRRKRVERLLSVSSDREKLFITLDSWCDLYDRGFTVLIAVTTLWLFTSVMIHQWLWTALGVLFFLARISAKPLYWYLFGRHIARKRKVTMEIYEELNFLGSEKPTPTKEMPSIEIV